MSITELLPSYAFDGETISFSVTDLPDITNEECHPQRGDFRKLGFALCSVAQTYWDGLDTGSRPNNFAMYNPSQRVSQFAEDAIKKTYSFRKTKTFNFSDPEVVDEP